MATATLQIYLSEPDTSNSTTVGWRLRMLVPDPVDVDYLLLNTAGFFLLNAGGAILLTQQAGEGGTPAGVDTNIFVYEVIEYGGAAISVFIGIASPEDMVNLDSGEPVNDVIGKRFRLKEIDLLFRSKIHCEDTIRLVSEDITQLFRLRSLMVAIPAGDDVQVIS